MSVDAPADVDPARGLSGEEVAARAARGDVNALPTSPTRTVPQIVAANVFTRFNAILGGMLAIIIIVGPFQDALFGVVLVGNALIGIVQELRAKRTLDRLTVLTAPRARVVRDGEVREVRAGAIVKDDVVDALSGAQILVDGSVLSGKGLEVDESLLTGEAEPVVKSPGDGLLSGSFVVAGSGRYRATDVGADAAAAFEADAAAAFGAVSARLELALPLIRGSTMAPANTMTTSTSTIGMRYCKSFTMNDGFIASHPLAPHARRAVALCQACGIAVSDNDC